MLPATHLSDNFQKNADFFYDCSSSPCFHMEQVRKMAYFTNTHFFGLV